VNGARGEAPTGAITESLHRTCKLRGDVAVISPDILPNEGAVISDIRKYT
jgi:hypothetical protein